MALDLTGFENLSPDELREASKQLQQLAYRKEGGTKKWTNDRLNQMLDIESDNFMGTGMDFHQFMFCGRLDEITQSFVTQDKDERKRRLGFIIRLGAELDGMRSQGVRQATGLAEAAIEAVILGDWYMVREWAGHFTFEDEHDDTRRQYAPLYAPFVGLLREAFDTRPQAEAPTPKAPH